jgi:hypothetical protein
VLPVGILARGVGNDLEHGNMLFNPNPPCFIAITKAAASG